MDKLLSLLGMCRKANKLSCGHDGAVGAVRSGKAKLCLLSSDSSDRLRKEAEREINFKKEQIPIAVTQYSNLERSSPHCHFWSSKELLLLLLLSRISHVQLCATP